MRGGERKCATPTCTRPAPRDYPFCYPCWLDVPKQLRDAVKRELAKRGTPDLDRAALYLVVSSAAASVAEAPAGAGAEYWERLWVQAGRPELEVVGK